MLSDLLGMRSSISPPQATRCLACTGTHRATSPFKAPEKRDQKSRKHGDAKVELEEESVGGAPLAREPEDKMVRGQPGDPTLLGGLPFLPMPLLVRFAFGF